MLGESSGGSCSDGAKKIALGKQPSSKEEVAKTLLSPLSLYSLASDHVESSRRGSLGTLRSRAENDVEQLERGGRRFPRNGMKIEINAVNYLFQSDILHILLNMCDVLSEAPKSQ